MPEPHLPKDPEYIRKGLKRSLYTALVVVLVLLGPLVIKSCIRRFSGG